MSYTSPDSEDAAIEQPTIALFARLGWETLNCYQETFGPGSTLGRETAEQVVLEQRLRGAIERLNPGISPLALDLAVDEVVRDRSIQSPVTANRDIFGLLRDGVQLPSRRSEDDDEEVPTVQIIDWSDPDNNDWFLASQFWISGDYGSKRADLIGFVNGIPLLFMELKASHKALANAFKYNLSDYRTTIPQIFWYNSHIILSNGTNSRLGSMTAGWEHFSDWKRINEEGEKGVISLETIIRGVCDRNRFLDLVENFTLYSEGKGQTAKLIAKNHQFLGVNNAVAAVEKIKDNHGKLGVFWHTQGSGKSFSMVFFSQKVLRKVPGNWTFLIVTDRDDLDGQIYRNFASTGAVLEAEERVRAQSADHLKQLLAEDHRYLFTLIQKFRTEGGAKYPKLSDRSDIVVITDEAHRSQYDLFALNMRNALPNAAFIGFTGTPLMVGEELTKEVFGDYVSIYNFKQSIDDANTVALYYENRIPEVQLTNPQLNEDMADILDSANLDEDQEAKLEREFSREYTLITRDDRLETIAEDIVAHYMGRGVLAKAMVISIDKATAVRMYDKVQKHWKVRLVRLRTEMLAADVEDKPDLEKRLRFFEETDMAVVVSPSQNEIEEFKKKGLDIAKHRKRMVKEDLETKFKDADDPLRIVFVCAMWITGFDVPSCSTMYLDKPMRNHTLMQTIARANRVWGEKQNGLIVDYVGIFRDLQRALAIYGTAKGKPGEKPIKEKAELVKQLCQAIAEAAAFCTQQGVDPEKIRDAKGFEREKLKEDAVAALVATDDIRRRYTMLAGNVEKLFKSLLPDAAANEFGPIRKVFVVVAEKIRSEIPSADISEVMDQVEDLLDESIVTQGYVIRPSAVDKGTANYIDLSKIDFDALRRQFEKGRKTIEAQRLRGQIATRLAQMVRLNRTRMNYLEEFQKMVDEYNSGAANVETFFARLMAFTKKLSEEEKRGISEQLSEEELAVFDLLTKPAVKLTRAEEREVKKIARELLENLKREKLVLDWKKRQTTRAAVRYTVEMILDQLPRVYTPELYQQKCDAVYQHVFDSYAGQGKSLYASAN